MSFREKRGASGTPEGRVSPSQRALVLVSSDPQLGPAATCPHSVCTVRLHSCLLPDPLQKRLSCLVPKPPGSAFASLSLTQDILSETTRHKGFKVTAANVWCLTELVFVSVFPDSFYTQQPQTLESSTLYHIIQNTPIYGYVHAVTTMIPRRA